MEHTDVVQAEQVTNDQTVVDTNPEQVDTRSKEELLKRLREVSDEAKSNRQRLAQQKRDAEAHQKKTMEEQGQYKELADIYKSKAESEEKKSQTLKSAFATKLVADAVALEATKLGCVDADAVLQLLDLSAIPIDDTFSVDKNHVKTVLEEFKKGKSYLFQKATPRIPDGSPGKVVVNAPKSVDKMTSQEIEALLRSGRFK